MLHVVTPTGVDAVEWPENPAEYLLGRFPAARGFEVKSLTGVELLSCANLPQTSCIFVHRNRCYKKCRSSFAAVRARSDLAESLKFVVRRAGGLKAVALVVVLPVARPLRRTQVANQPSSPAKRKAAQITSNTSSTSGSEVPCVLYVSRRGKNNPKATYKVQASDPVRKLVLRVSPHALGIPFAHIALFDDQRKLSRAQTFAEQGLQSGACLQLGDGRRHCCRDWYFGAPCMHAKAGSKTVLRCRGAESYLRDVEEAVADGSITTEGLPRLRRLPRPVLVWFTVPRAGKEFEAVQAAARAPFTAPPASSTSAPTASS